MDEILKAYKYFLKLQWGHSHTKLTWLCNNCLSIHKLGTLYHQYYNFLTIAFDKISSKKRSKHTSQVAISSSLVYFLKQILHCIPFLPSRFAISFHQS